LIWEVSNCLPKIIGMKPNSPLANFDPRRLARFEKDNYVAYYQKNWLRLLSVSLSMVKEAFGLNWAQAFYGAYLIAKAEIAFAPDPNNDLKGAETFMRKFFAFINRVHHENLDVEAMAKLEIEWWVIHRELFANPNNERLVDVLARYWAKTYRVPIENVREAARLRALGMLFSDQWVRSGKVSNSPLLEQEEKALYEGYTALKKAIC
jgi:hypothetical protein